MLSFNMAKNKHATFSWKRARLGYSNGIITLAVGAIALLCIFNRSTNASSALYDWGVHSICAIQTWDGYSLKRNLVKAI